LPIVIENIICYNVIDNGNDNGNDNKRSGAFFVHLRSGRATIKEVASAAGVSTQTVSRVINDRPDVSPETRKRVQEVIDQLGYQPSALARSLIRQRSYTLGVVTAGLKYIGPSRTLSGITSAAERAGYSLLLKELPSFNSNNVVPIFQTLLSRHVDGIIWAVSEVGENLDWANSLSLEIDIPIVHLTMKSRGKVWVVSIDNYLGGQLAMSHLIEQGYQHIGHISGPLDWWEARERKAAWCDGLKEAKIEVKEEHWVEGNWSSASGARAIEQLYKQYPEMDAVFVANDQMALSVIQYACRKGVRIPADLGVVAFDDIPESAYFWPPLTTVQQDQYNVGEIAVEEIIKIIESGWHEHEPVRPKSIMLTPTLVVRQSSIKKKG
jgi:DNA-binding LacI/PurR family transcriptional regulator